jgi:hypothetical protein
MRSSRFKFLRFLRDFFGEFAHELLDRPEMALVDHSEHRLVIHSGDVEFVVDRRVGTVARSGRPVARIDAIRTIDIGRTKDEDGPEYWTVSLYLSWFSRVHIGSTTDDVEASIIAAHLSTITGKKVLA